MVIQLKRNNWQEFNLNYFSNKKPPFGGFLFDKHIIFYFCEISTIYWYSVFYKHCDVLCHAKIQIWKQFTTCFERSRSSRLMCCAMQRYKFESNSQPGFDFGDYVEGCVVPCKDTNLKAIHNIVKSVIHNVVRCVVPCKDTNLKAIHNHVNAVVTAPLDVLCHAKIQIWKQFTTGQLTTSLSQVMCCAMQRYKFESNSQHVYLLASRVFRCVVPCKDTNLKAIHNGYLLKRKGDNDVLCHAKIQIWKQFTTPLRNVYAAWPMCCAMQRYKFESNSQHGGRGNPAHRRCVVPCKDTNLKAIHNRLIAHISCVRDVLCHAKIQIWKQFTTPGRPQTVHPHDVLCHAKIQIWKQFTTERAGRILQVWDVLCHAKIQIWKQFTTTNGIAHSTLSMCCAMQRYKFESNSQHLKAFSFSFVRCVVPCKDTNLKAIHNHPLNHIDEHADVLCHAKIQIWKQFTNSQRNYDYNHNFWIDFYDCSLNFGGRSEKKGQSRKLI